MTTKRVLGIGPLSPPITGPGLKNKYIKAGLESQGFEVHWINTLEQRPQTVLDILAKTVSYDAYILSASTKVRLFVGPVLASRLRSPDVHGVLFPAGGEFANELNALPDVVRDFYVRTFSTFDAIFPQTDALSQDLEEIFRGRTQIRTVPNLRPLPDTPPTFRDGSTAEDAIRLVYVGRIKESKGIGDLLDAFELATESGANVELDIYGHFLPDDPFEDAFLEQCSLIPGVRFHGKLPNDAVVETLKQSDAFMFPTFYDGEGFPGALVEAFAAGCPVIATDWNFNSEIVTDGSDGLLFEPRDVSELAEKITWLSEHRAELGEMQRNAFERSKQYSVDAVSSDIVRYLEEAGWELDGPAVTHPKP